MDIKRIWTLNVDEDLFMIQGQIRINIVTKI